MHASQQQKSMLITGGTGKTGRRVAARLIQQGLSVQIGSRTGQQPFDWENPATWPPLLANAESAYINFSPDLAFPGAVETIDSFSRLAVSSGVRHIVLLSGRGEPSAQLAEQIIQSCGAEWTILRASFFCQNFSEGFLAEPIEDGRVNFPAGDVLEPFVDADDIADLAAVVLTEAGHAGQLYEVTGPRLMTFAECVRGIADAVGRPIHYCPISLEEYSAGLLLQGLPLTFVKPLIALFQTVLDGRNSYTTDTIQQVLQRPPRDFTTYARSLGKSEALTHRA